MAELKKESNFMRYVDNINAGYYIGDDDTLKEFKKNNDMHGVYAFSVREFDDGNKAVNMALLCKANKDLKKAVKEIRKDQDKKVLPNLRIGVSLSENGIKLKTLTGHYFL